ncbi:hypothetical protein [Microbacterium istanbulense]|uniref:Uncharacterized protein n=1 Tax=Microbacterium istanbulense TaxID=3122049 RepID=A0ABU8LJM8_9MICO
MIPFTKEFVMLELRAVMRTGFGIANDPTRDVDSSAISIAPSANYGWWSAPDQNAHQVQVL